MDRRDWAYIGLFVGLYLTITATGTIMETDIPGWRLGIYGALIGTSVVGVLVIGAGWLRSRTAS